MPYAAAVAALFRATYGASLACSSGLTWNCCTRAGQIEPISTEEKAIRASAASGSAQVRRSGVARNSTAQMTAIPHITALAGSTALASV
nr:hypothetical protein [Streptacidiphilus jeojiense]